MVTLAVGSDILPVAVRMVAVGAVAGHAPIYEGLPNAVDLFLVDNPVAVDVPGLGGDVEGRQCHGMRSSHAVSLMVL